MRLIIFDFQLQKRKFEKTGIILIISKNINGTFDLIYSSHSLEHVDDIFSTIEKFQSISHENTIFFFEVPNCFNKNFRKSIAPILFILQNYFSKLF